MEYSQRFSRVLIEIGWWQCWVGRCCVSWFWWGVWNWKGDWQTGIQEQDLIFGKMERIFGFWKLVVGCTAVGKCQGGNLGFWDRPV